MADVIEGSVSYPQEKAANLPSLSGPYTSLAEAEKVAREYTKVGTNVVIDYRDRLGNRPIGYMLLDAGEAS